MKNNGKRLLAATLAALLAIGVCFFGLDARLRASDTDGTISAQEQQAAEKQNAELVIPAKEENKPEAPKAEEPKAEEQKTEAPKAEEPKAEESKTETPKAEEPKAEEPKTEAPKAEEPKAEEPKAEEAKPEEEPADRPEQAELPETELPAADSAEEAAVPEELAEASEESAPAEEMLPDADSSAEEAEEQQELEADPQVLVCSDFSAYAVSDVAPGEKFTIVVRIAAANDDGPLTPFIISAESEAEISVLVNSAVKGKAPVRISGAAVENGTVRLRDRRLSVELEGIMPETGEVAVLIKLLDSGNHPICSPAGKEMKCTVKVTAPTEALPEEPAEEAALDGIPEETDPSEENGETDLKEVPAEDFSADEIPSEDIAPEQPAEAPGEEPPEVVTPAETSEEESAEEPAVGELPADETDPVPPEETPIGEQPVDPVPAEEELSSEEPAEEEISEENVPEPENEPVEEEPSDAEKLPVDEVSPEDEPLPEEEALSNEDEIFTEITDRIELLLEISEDPDTLADGETLILRAVVKGLEPDAYTVVWQCDRGTGDWQDISGYDGLDLPVLMAAANQGLSWRYIIVLK